MPLNDSLCCVRIGDSALCGQCVDSVWTVDSGNVSVVQAGNVSLGRPILSVLWYCSLIAPSLFPTLAPTARPGHPARDTTLADSTNRVRLATVSVVSSSVSSQATQVSSKATLAVAGLPWLAPVVYSAGKDSMASMTVWKYRKYGRPKELSILHSGHLWNCPGLQVRHRALAARPGHV